MNSKLNLIILSMVITFISLLILMIGCQVLHIGTIKMIITLITYSVLMAVLALFGVIQHRYLDRYYVAVWIIRYAVMYCIGLILPGVFMGVLALGFIGIYELLGIIDRIFGGRH
jgi:hypothetical protein